MQQQKWKKESFMQGVLAMMFSQVFIKLLGLVYKLYLTNRPGFGDEGNAIYSAGFSIYALLLTLSSVGIPNAISKLISEKVAKGDARGANRVFKVAFFTFGMVGFLGSMALFLGAHEIAYDMLQIPEAELTLVALSPSIFFVALTCVIRGYFNGISSLKVTANSQTLEQIFKMVFTIGIVEMVAILLKANTTVMAAGANLATTLATISSFGYLLLFYRTNRQLYPVRTKKGIKRESIRSILKNIFMVAMPISLSAILSSITKNIDSVTIVRGLKNFMDENSAKIQYGILTGKADTLTTLPLSFNIALATALVPAISYAKAKNDQKAVDQKIGFSMLITILIGLPCTVGMFIFADPILKLLFPAQPDGAYLLQVSAIGIIFTVLTQTINGALQGIGKVMTPAIAFFIGVILKLIINISCIGIPTIGIQGAIIGTIICNIVACIIGFIVLKKNTKISFSIKKYIIKPIIATIIMGATSFYGYQFFFCKSQKIAIVIAIGIAIISYLISVLALKILGKEEILMLPLGQKMCNLIEKNGIKNRKKRTT